MAQLTSHIGGMTLTSPLIAASGTVGAVWEWAEIADTTRFGAAVAKSVAPEAWAGRPAPRLAPTGTGMLNGIGIQNPGIEAWIAQNSGRLGDLGLPVWGSAVGGDPKGYADVAIGLEQAGVAAIEVNLSCPNLEDGQIFSFDGDLSAAVVSAVAGVTRLSIGAKLAPNTPDIVEVAAACVRSGADFLVLTNTALGFGLSLTERRPLLSGGVGGYSGPGLKPISMRCVYEVAKADLGVPIVGCGGVSTGQDVAEYLMAGASAVEVGTVLLADPNAGRRIINGLSKTMRLLGIESVASMVGMAL